MRCGGGYRRVAEQFAHQKTFIIGNIGHRDAQQIIPFTGHRIAFDDFGMAFGKLFKIAPYIWLVRFHPYLAEHIDAPPHGFGVEQPDRRPEYTGGFQRAYAAPAGGGGGADLFCQRGMADRPIPLQYAQDFAVDIIKMN